MTLASYACTDETLFYSSNLSPTILLLKSLGIDNIIRFDYLTPPPAELLLHAFTLLSALQLIDPYAKLTHPLGTRVSELALPPMMAVALLRSHEYDVLSEVLTIAAMTSAQGSTSIWVTHSGASKATESSRRKFAAEEGDHLTLLNFYQAFVTKGKKQPSWCHQHNLNAKSLTRAVSIRGQLARYLQRMGIPIPEAKTSPSLPGGISAADQGIQIRKALTAGFFAHAARMQPDGSFRGASGGLVLYAHPSSLMFNRKAEWVVYGEGGETGGKGKVYMRDVTTVEKAWLLEEVGGEGGYYRVDEKGGCRP